MLIKPPFAWAHCSDSLPSTPTTQPDTVTAGANNADGASVGVLPALSHDAEYLVIGVGGNGGAGINSRALLDILIDPAGGTAWSSLIDNLQVGFLRPQDSNTGFTAWFHFPLWIPAGATLGARARTAHTATRDHYVGIWAFGGPSRPDMWWCGTKVETLGAVEASSKGTDVTPGNSGAFGAWADIGVTTGRWGAIQPSIGGPGSVAATQAYQWEIGYSSVRIPGVPQLFSAISVSEVGPKSWSAIMNCDIPQGTTLQVRGKGSATADVIDVLLHGVY